MTKSVYQVVLHLTSFYGKFFQKKIMGHSFSFYFIYNPLIFSKIIITNNFTEFILITFNYDEANLMDNVKQNADLKNIINWFFL